MARNGVDLASRVCTEMQMKFAAAYAATGKAGPSARRAGYKHPDKKGPELLKIPHVQVQIRKIKDGIADAVDVDAAFIISGLKDISLRCRIATPVRDKTGRILDGEWTFDASGANRALELLGKHLGLFSEKIDITLTRAAAVDYMEQVLTVIFSVVKDEALRDEIMKAIDAAAIDDGGTS